MLLLHMTKIIDLGRAGDGYDCFYARMQIIGHTMPLRYYGVRKVCRLSQAFIPYGS